MNGLRKFSVAVCLLLFTVSIFLVVILNSLLLTVGKPQNVKTWLNNAGVYPAVNKTIASQLKQKVDTEAGTVDSSQPQIQNALLSALSTKFLQVTSEKIIDGTYHWLNGNVKIPDFQIDISGVKQTFADNVREYAKNRYESLPPCARGFVPNTSDILNIECRVAGYDIGPALQKITQNIVANQDFLPSNVITADNLNELQGNDKDNKNENKKSFNFEDLKAIPENYQRAKLANTVLIITAFVFGISAIVLSASKSRGAKRVARVFISVGAVYTIIGAIVMWGVDRINIIKIKMDDTQALQEALQKLSKLAVKDNGKIILIFGVSYLLIGVVTILVINYANKDKPRGDSSGDILDKDPTKTKEKT